MIFDSSYWKQPLLEISERLLDRSKYPSDSSARYAEIERDIFIGFYSVRKLFEAGDKLSKSTKDLKLAIKWCQKRNAVQFVDQSIRFDLWELYDQENWQGETRSVKYVYNQIIHSFIFALSGDPKESNHGYYFVSDTDKDKRLNFITNDVVVELFNLVGNDYPINANFQCDAVSD